MFKKLKLLFLVFKSYKKIRSDFMDMKITKTELYTTIFAQCYAVYLAVQGFIPHELTIKIVAILTGIYALSRGIAKITPTKKDDEFLDKISEIVKQKK